MHHVYADAVGGQRASDSLELDLQMVMNYYVGDGAQTWVLEPSLQSLRFFFLLSIYVSASVCHMCAGTHRDQKKESDIWAGVT